MAKLILWINDLSKSIGKKEILKNITLKVYSGEVFGFLGPNGSGKTTTIKTMLGLLNYKDGSIKICNHEVKDDFEAAVANVGGIIENPEMYKYLTGRQNLMQYARMQRGISKERIEEVIDTVDLRARINDKISKYSLGMRQRLGIAQAILHRPKLLVLDEPTNGLDPAGIKDLRDILCRLAHEEGCAVFVSSHMLAELELMCDRVCVINSGRVINTMTMQEIHGLQSDNVKIAYRIITEDTAEAEKIAEESGMEYRLNDGELEVMTERSNISAYIKALALADINVEGVIPQQKSLEDAFMEMIGDAPRGGVGQ
ncbi:MAG: ABC transporter ATP-binding protein [Firmicutes bacterium]|nr:ABC transporter ATP-binding protein [Bacillota bacterium]